MEMDCDTDQLLEEKLKHLSEYDNTTQLLLLIDEIERIMDYAIQPPIQWFEQRIDHVIAYSGLKWSGLASQTFDDHLATIGSTVIRCGQQIMDDWSVSPLFDISDYYTMLHAVNEARIYFNAHYMIPNHDDGELFDVMAGIANL